jgi:hypothetical protein
MSSADTMSIEECYLKAQQCRELAESQSDPAVRSSFLIHEKWWIRLAVLKSDNPKKLTA